jgi:steroid delta-isomerase-like uncharacterized protein
MPERKGDFRIHKMNRTPKAFSMNTREDLAFRFLGVPSLMRATSETTKEAFALMEQWEMPVGFASPYHTHHREDESFYVLEGEIAFVCGGKWAKAGCGTFVYGPREIPHGFRVIGQSPARMLILCTPGGFERFVLEQTTPITEPPSPPDMGKLMMLAAKYGIDIHGPLPEEPDDFVAEAKPTEDLKSLNHRWIQAFNDRDWQTESAVRDESFRAYLSGLAEPLDNAAWSGFMAAFTTAFPDSRISIESCIAEGDTVVTRWTLTGTHRGPFQGIPPTGRPIRFNGLEFNRALNGRLVEHWSMFDNLALLRQIGAIPA